ncbi:hypothetical protein NKR23_g11910 [Pleurostoma richardsiae]|uniref:Uncharacterized protein n=1 Tax=Pleurostoma richardsiae TaxID=41990 RepID=A0AA38VGA3_9PEZI|nr:hypothetical protein NKR23_g11910 [Pleurostoma richardsiae]
MQADVEPRFGGYACGVFSPGRFVSMEESTSAAAAAAGSWDGNPYLMPSVQLDHGLTSPLQTSLEMSTALSHLYAEYSTGSQGMYDAEAANLPTEPPWVANGAHSGLAAQSWPSMDENDQRQSFATPIPYPNDGKVALGCSQMLGQQHPELPVTAMPHQSTNKVRAFVSPRSRARKICRRARLGIGDLVEDGQKMTARGEDMPGKGRPRFTPPTPTNCDDCRRQHL